MESSKQTDTGMVLTSQWLNHPKVSELNMEQYVTLLAVLLRAEGDAELTWAVKDLPQLHPLLRNRTAHHVKVTLQRLTDNGLIGLLFAGGQVTVVLRDLSGTVKPELPPAPPPPPITPPQPLPSGLQLRGNLAEAKLSTPQEGKYAFRLVFNQVQVDEADLPLLHQLALRPQIALNLSQIIGGTTDTPPQPMPLVKQPMPLVKQPMPFVKTATQKPVQKEEAESMDWVEEPPDFSMVEGDYMPPGRIVSRKVFINLEPVAGGESWETRGDSDGSAAPAVGGASNSTVT